MTQITTTGLDIAKTTFHAMHCNQAGRNMKKKKLTRKQLLEYFATLPAHLIGIEACSAAHYWARELRKQGHEVRLIAPQFVKPYVRGNKHDFNDAAAIAEAVTRPEMRFVAVKTVEQHDTQTLFGIRKQATKERTAHANMVRGLLSEYGIVIKQGIHQLFKALPEILEDAENNLSPAARAMFQHEYEQLQYLSQRLEMLTASITEKARNNSAIERLMSVPGFGPIVASAFYHHVGNGCEFKKGRDVSASIGLVPRQHSTGGKQNLLGISKRGDKHLRALLIHGARSILRLAGNKQDKLSVWATELAGRRGFNKAAVALANKLARIGWAVTVKNEDYIPA